jgi:hypothetical protein
MYDKTVKAGAKALNGVERNDKIRDQCAGAKEFQAMLETGAPLNSEDVDRVMKQINGLPPACAQEYNALVTFIAKQEGEGGLDTALSTCEKLKLQWEPPSEWGVGMEQARTLASLRRAINHGADAAVLFAAGWLDGLRALTLATDTSKANALELVERAPCLSKVVEGNGNWINLVVVMQEINIALRADVDADLDTCVYGIMGTTSNLLDLQSDLKANTTAMAQKTHPVVSAILSLTCHPDVEPTPSLEHGLILLNPCTREQTYTMIYSSATRELEFSRVL